MTGTLEIQLAAMACFVLGHFVLSSLPVRHGIIGIVGENAFRGLYSVGAVASLVWAGFAYGAAPFEPLWDPPAWARHVTYLCVLAACLFVVIGVTTKNPTSVGGEKFADDPAPASGILTVTRHPFLIGTTLWSIGHLFANGDAASVILFGGILVLSIGGMLHIDHRRRIAMGSAWGPIALSTSVVPFLALVQGRSKLDLKGIGLPRIAGGLAVFAALAYGHTWIAGVPLF